MCQLADTDSEGFDAAVFLRECDEEDASGESLTWATRFEHTKPTPPSAVVAAIGVQLDHALTSRGL